MHVDRPAGQGSSQIGFKPLQAVKYRKLKRAIRNFVCLDEE